MRNYLCISFLLIFSCSGNHSNIVETMFKEHKVDWNIEELDYRWLNYDYYGEQLGNCGLNISPLWVKKVNSYRLKFLNAKEVVVEVIDLKEKEDAEKFYTKLLLHTNTVRSTKRNDDWKVCGEIREWQFHYTVIKNKEVFIIGCVVGNFKFNNGEQALESDSTNLYEAKKVYEYLNSK
jgi:hypothetical protein